MKIEADLVNSDLGYSTKNWPKYTTFIKITVSYANQTYDFSCGWTRRCQMKVSYITFTENI